ncbi:hypothetical protein CSE16_08800 [Solibacillus sp. R5-41]|uniref:hypothetical protein n=1 Tax=Solibacillus sp. R5-41 TaxID=2048654 RepID=UPI000C129587|nr:hypothetical protein [Solibacillus sp. R5-41]ATP40138.1 hypothetical protein CSE16_08800 [Solibacillus sp. R5-41]
MLNIDQRELVHGYLMLDLAVQSLQTDYSKMEQTEQMKMKKIYLPLHGTFKLCCFCFHRVENLWGRILYRWIRN